MPRSLRRAIFGATTLDDGRRQTNPHEPITLPLAHAHGVIMVINAAAFTEFQVATGS